MALVKVNKDPSIRELRQFAGIWLPLFCLLVGWIIQRQAGTWTPAFYLWGVCAAVSVAGLWLPQLIKPLFVGLMYTVFPLGFVLSYVILAVIYYLLITPVGLIMRLVGYDPLNRKLDPAADTYWIEREAQPESSRYFRQF
jgi:hypothetical protein